MDKKEIARILEEIASLLEIKGENPFRVRAYRNGARALLNIEENLDKVIDEDKLTEYEGIGDHLAKRIIEAHKKGKLPYYEKLKKSIPPGLLDLIEIQGLGPKKAKLLYQKLKIRSVADLKKAATHGKISKVKGFGSRMEKNILSSIEDKERAPLRYLWWNAKKIAEPILKQIKKVKGVVQAEICGSFRRKLETVGDLDFLVASTHPKAVIDWFISKLSVKVISKGEAKLSIRLENGMQADLRVVTPSQYPFALAYFTGSKEHTIKLRTLCLKKGLSLNEYGFTPKRKVKTEEDLYKALSLSYIPPCLRENTGEIEAAAKNKIPKLIELKDIRGTFHNHTTASDGRNNLKEMVEAAEKLKWEYIGISDHSKSSVQAHGLSEERLEEQIEAIKKLNSSKKYKIHVFSGTECDILPNGSLDFSEKTLKKLDFVIASVHSSFQQSEKEMTRRIIKALEHPMTTMLGHSTGRLLLRRKPYSVDLAKVIDAAIANRKIIEINGNPQRMDMDWRLWRQAAKKGLLCCINCDAHATEHLEFIESGVNVARKGWLTKKDVINTLPLKEILQLSWLLT